MKTWEEVLEYWNAWYQIRGIDPNNIMHVRKAISSVEGVDSLQNVVGNTVLAGYDAGIDTTAGWTRTVPLLNFKSSPITTVKKAARVHRIGRTECAPHMMLSVNQDDWQLCRFALQFALDEIDLADSQNLGALQLAIADVGAAMKRLLPDLLYATLLGNPTIGDDVALFHSSRGNIGSGGGSVLSEASLDTALAAIAAQTLEDEQRDPAHINLSGRYLIVPPAKVGLARRLARNLSNGDGDLIVRSESRLTTAGVVDPRDEEIVAANGTSWLLAAPDAQAPSVLVGHLDGNDRPRTRTYKLESGEYGVGFDATLDVAVKFIDGRPLYLSVGQ